MTSTWRTFLVVLLDWFMPACDFLLPNAQGVAKGEAIPTLSAACDALPNALDTPLAMDLQIVSATCELTP